MNHRTLWPRSFRLTLTKILHRLIRVVATVVDTIAQQVGIDAELACGAGEVLAGVL